MNDDQLRERLIKLGAEKPELRPHLRPLLQKKATYPGTINDQAAAKMTHLAEGGQPALAHLTEEWLSALIGATSGDWNVRLVIPTQVMFKLSEMVERILENGKKNQNFPGNGPQL